MIEYGHLVIDEDLEYEKRPIQIINRQVEQLRNKAILMVKVECKENLEGMLWYLGK